MIQGTTGLKWTDKWTNFGNFQDSQIWIAIPLNSCKFYEECVSGIFLVTGS